MNRTLARATGAFGLAHVVVLLTGFAISMPATRIGSPPSDFVDYYGGADSGTVFAGGYVECLGLLLFLPFAAGLHRLLRDREPRHSFGADTARLCAVGYVLLNLAPGMSAGAAALWVGHRGVTDVGLLTALDALRGFSHFIAQMALGGCLVAIAVSAYAAATLPRWLAVFAAVAGVLLVAGVAGAVAGWADLASLVGLVWLLVASGWLLTAAGRTRRMSAPAREMVA